MKAIVEIRAAEGGDDAKLLVDEMYSIYKKACSVNGFDHKLITKLDSILTFSL